MVKRDIKPWLKSALELGPPLLFFAAYMWFQDVTWEIGGTVYDGFILVTAAFVPLLLASIATLWVMTRRISRIQVVTAILVVVFGVLTIWFNDERFFKVKTTLVYGSFAVVLGIGLLRGQSWLKFVMGDLLPMRDKGWIILTKRLVGAFALMALANEIVWRTQSTEFWVTFETFGLPVFLFVVFMTQARLIERFSLSDDMPGEGDTG